MPGEGILKVIFPRHLKKRWDVMVKAKNNRVIDLDKDDAELTDREKAVARKYKDKLMDRMIRKSDMRVK